MKNLSIIRRGNVLYAESREIAKVIDMRHDNLLQKIDRYILVLTKSTDLKIQVSDFFLVSNYHDESGKENKCYLATKKGCDMIANKMTGDDGIVFTALYINQFYQMENLLQQLQSPIWQDTRALTKEIRKKETDAIRQLVEYAKANGSQNAVRYYTSLSVLTDQAAGIPPKGRDAAGIEELTRLYLVESMIDRCIQEGITRLLPYKDIYRGCKAQLLQFSALTCQG